MALPVMLDTDVFSFFFKQDTRAALYEPSLKDASLLCLSFQTVAELRLWALLRRWGEPRLQSLQLAFARYVVLPYDDTMSHAWASLTAHRRRQGRPIDTGDAWIAASALRHDATLLTHNGQDYSEIPNLRVVSFKG
jgi:predicted nucleic acid-binding protein